MRRNLWEVEYVRTQYLFSPEIQYAVRLHPHIREPDSSFAAQAEGLQGRNHPVQPRQPGCGCNQSVGEQGQCRRLQYQHLPASVEDPGERSRWNAQGSDLRGSHLDLPQRRCSRLRLGGGSPTALRVGKSDGAPLKLPLLGWGFLASPTSSHRSRVPGAPPKLLLLGWESCWSFFRSSA